MIFTDAERKHISLARDCLIYVSEIMTLTDKAFRLGRRRTGMLGGEPEINTLRVELADAVETMQGLIDRAKSAETTTTQ